MRSNYFAALDIGTNSFHMIIAEKTGQSFTVAAREREVLRLGSECSGEKILISDSEIKRAAVTIEKFKKTASHYNAEIKAIATSAVRDAANKKSLISEVLKRTGIEIEVIEGSKEAEYIFTGAEAALDLKDKDTFCFDIGGGSTELILRKEGKFLFSESLNLGAVRLSRMFFPDYILSDQKIKDCEAYIVKLMQNNKNLIFNKNAEINTGTSGTVQSALLISRSVFYSDLSPHTLNGFRITYDGFMGVFDEIMRRKTPAERLLVKGMEAKRADIIPAGFLILKNIFELFNLDSLVYSEYALREGIILSHFLNSSAKK